MIGRVTEALSKVKGSIGSNERHALPGVIGDDLLRFGKLPLCLFICIIITAITVVTTAHHTRLLTAQREQLAAQRGGHEAALAGAAVAERCAFFALVRAFGVSRLGLPCAERAHARARRSQRRRGRRPLEERPPCYG